MPPKTSTPLLYVALALHTHKYKAVDNILAYYDCDLITAIMIALADVFPTMQEAKDSINRHVLDEGESYKVYKSDKTRHIVVCKDSTCDFKIRASFLKKKGVQITIMTPHSCNPTIHYKNKQSSALWFLKDHHRLAVIDNRDITPAQIRSDERLRFGNNINYRQAHRVKEALLIEIEGNEADCFAKFPAYIEAIIAADENALCQIEVDDKTNRFKAAAFAPSATKLACQYLRRFVALDACYTKSRYSMMLLIAVGIDANDNVLPLSWALVPTENEEWWT